MVKSMTGYGRAEDTLNGCTITVELRSVNNRYLDCNVRMPRLYLFAEETIKSRVQNTISRGKVDVFVTLDSTGGEQVQVSVNQPLADGYYAALIQLAERYGAYVQTHCNEGQWEHDVVLERFGKTDPYALRDFGLLREHSLMAHCPYLTEEEGEMFAELGVAVAHCPMANSYFSSAVAPVKRFRQQGINVGLGTDISGGYSPSMYENIRQAV